MCPKAAKNRHGYLRTHTHSVNCRPNCLSEELFDTRLRFENHRVGIVSHLLLSTCLHSSTQPSCGLSTVCHSLHISVSAGHWLDCATNTTAFLQMWKYRVWLHTYQSITVQVECIFQPLSALLIGNQLYYYFIALHTILSSTTSY